jgi:spoIIIJ-associated protein
MEWVETTGKTVNEARDLALDRLGVAEEEAEIEVLEEPRTGLFGRIRGEARVRARIRPTAVRPKQDRRGRVARQKGKDRDEPNLQTATSPTQESAPVAASPGAGGRERAGDGDQLRDSGQRDQRQRQRSKQRKERPAVDANDQEARDRSADRDEQDTQESDPVAVGQAAVEFMTGLAAAFGADASASLHVEGNELDVRVEGEELGLLIGPGGRTLLAVQDLARVASQRRLGDHDTRLRIDVAGYRERRRAALEKFAVAVANEVLASHVGKALEPMASADRKVVHDAIQGIEGVTSHSDGEEPRRRVVITPA